MSLGTLYNHNVRPRCLAVLSRRCADCEWFIKPSPRSTAILIVAKAHGLHLDVVYADKDDKENYEELLKFNPLGRVPTFVGSDGYVLTECIPITLYSTRTPSDPQYSFHLVLADHFPQSYVPE
jgi:hypothetical protein